jgi:hypothetical protein
MQVIQSTYCNILRSVAVSTSCKSYSHHTLTSHGPLLFLAHASHTITIELHLTVRCCFYLMQVIQSPYSNISRSVAVSTSCKSYSHRTVTSHGPLLFLSHASHTVTMQYHLTVRCCFYLLQVIQSPYSNISRFVAVSTSCKSYRHPTVTSHGPLLFIPHASHTVTIH